MSLFDIPREIVGAWTDTVAAAIVDGFDYIVSPRVIRLIEGENEAFTLEPDVASGAGPVPVAFTAGSFVAPGLAQSLKGSRVEIVLASTRFLFRPLELPARAADFLEGIVRAQIDRLTPWSAAEALFGCSAPLGGSGDSITTTIAATTRKAVNGYVQAASNFHPASVAVFAAAAPGSARIKVFEQKARGHLDAARLGRALRAGLAVTAVAALLSTAAAVYLADHLGAQEEELARQISQRRAALRANSDGADRSPLAALERRKHESPASVIVLDALTRALPDNTYVTELHLAGNKLQVVGITRDAPSLIPLIEQSRHFTRATFYAPTTRSSSDAGERFHIETRVEPNNTVNQ